MWMSRQGLWAALVFLCWWGTAATAELPEGLTPLGAERAAGVEGRIPAWDGGLTPANSPPVTTGLTDPFAKEEPLFVIDADNMAQYLEYLPLGQQALLRRYPDTYRLPIYASHRTAAAPQRVYDETARNHQRARLVNDGNGLEQAYGGVPFPVPEKAAGEVDPIRLMWNHLTRWRGVYLKASLSEAAVQSNGTHTPVTTQQEAYFVYYNPDKGPDALDNKLAYYLAFIKSPPRLAGGGLLVHETIDRVKEPRNAWVYNAGTRRVRRAPSVEYDMPVPSSDNLITADDVDMFNGALDRFLWRFVGKQALYIPYNSYRLSNATSADEPLLLRGHINPDLTRYELHRVWIVEAVTRPGVRHLYSKRRFYIDEDTWGIVQADQYDTRGELWRVHLAHTVNYYHVPVTWAALQVSHELDSGRYFAGYLDNASGMAIEFQTEAPSERYFSPQSLRRMGR
ncbi:MAG: DUF1329 domain-containing protein [Pseudomonadota bacterium]|nr:DUF1329 domain-containing protein [Pseudomonadota bacterium]